MPGDQHHATQLLTTVSPSGCNCLRTSGLPVPTTPFTNYKHPFVLSAFFFRQPPRQPHALQTLSYPPSSLDRCRPSTISRAPFGTLTTPQVRAVVAPSNDLILSASRDSTAISWIKQSGSSFSPANTFRAGSRFVNSVAYLQPTSEAPQGENVSS